MALIGIQRFRKKYLVVYLYVYCGASKFENPLPFVVDTGSERTFIVPKWEAVLRNHFEGRKKASIGFWNFTKEREASQTFLGSIYFKFAKGFALWAETIDGNIVPINDKDGVLNIACKRGWLAGKALGNVSVNVLGRDILNEWTLYLSPKREPRAMFLLSDQSFIDDFLAGHDITLRYYKRLEDERKREVTYDISVAK